MRYKVSRGNGKKPNWTWKDSQKSETNQCVNPIVGITTQKGTIPSDIKTEDFDISRKIFSKDEKSCKIS